MFFKTYITEFDKSIIIPTDQNGRPLEIEGKVNLTFLINKEKRRWYSVEPRTGKYVKGYRFLSFARKSKIQLSDTGIDALKTVSKKVFHKAAEATDEVLEKKIPGKIVKPDENPRNAEEIIIVLEKRGKNIKGIETSTIKIENYKISKLLNDSTTSKFVTKNGLK